tara:strand:- start:502 stop:1026 length:525 start_codon:yes stop_codon:yes gene_type:complete
MGTLTVQTLQAPTSGANANKVIIPSGHTLHAAGHTLQTVYNASPDNSLQAIDSASFVATNISVSITPKSSSSSMFITCNVNFDSATGTNFSAGIFKDGTIVTPKSPSGTYDAHIYFNRLSEGRLIMHQSIHAIDATVGTTSAVTYKLYVKTHSGNINLRHDLSSPRIIVQEIAA